MSCIIPSRKNEVETHSEGYGQAYPALNVKIGHYGDISAIVNRLDCSEDVAERALRWAFEQSQKMFWEEVQELANNVFPYPVKVYSEGRMSGWVIVKGLGDIADWDAIALTYWRSFAVAVKKSIDWYTTEECIMDAIELNRWAEEGAEKYNYVNQGEKTVCLADVPHCLHCQ